MDGTNDRRRCCTTDDRCSLDMNRRALSASRGGSVPPAGLERKDGWMEGRERELMNGCELLSLFIY